MNEKRMLLLSFFVVAFLMFLLAGWYYFSQQKQAAEVVVDRNYDYVMKNDPIGQNKQAQTDYYTLVLSWSPAFCERQRQQYGDTKQTSSKSLRSPALLSGRFTAITTRPY